MSRAGAFLISGAGSGIGLALAAKIIAAGHHVYGLGRDPKKLEHAARTLGAQHFSFSSVDLSRPDESTRVIQEIRRWLKAGEIPLLGLVNNAGIFDRVSFLQSSDSLWSKHFENNLMSAVRLTRDVFEDLKAGQPSSVLNISSTLGVRPVVDTSVYSAMKAAMVNWTQSLALEWAKDGIRVNCICPGVVDTPIHGFHAEDANSEGKRQVAKLHPLGRLGTADDVAEAGWFLLSEKSSWTTGAVLTVDGGISL